MLRKEKEKENSNLNNLLNAYLRNTVDEYRVPKYQIKSFLLLYVQEALTHFI